MRVLLWGELFWPYIGGAELFAARLMVALRERGHEFSVVTSHDYLELPDEAHYQGIPVYRFPFRSALKPDGAGTLIPLRRRVADLCRDLLKPGLILLNGVSPSAFFCRRAAQACGAPLVVRLNQELLPIQSGPSAGTLLDNVLRQAVWTVGVSASTLEQAKQLVPAICGRSSVIPNGIDAEPQPPSAPRLDPPRILCVGRLAPQKGFDLAVGALPAILQRWPQARLTIAGDGPERSALAAQAVALGVDAAIDMLGWVVPDAVPELVSRSSLVLLPSRFEGLPSVALQAAAHGRPIVASHVGGVPEIVEHGTTGLLVEPDSGAFSRAVASILEQPALASRMGLAAWRRAQSRFSWQHCLDAYDVLFRRVAVGA